MKYVAQDINTTYYTLGSLRDKIMADGPLQLRNGKERVMDACINQLNVELPLVELPLSFDTVSDAFPL